MRIAVDGIYFGTGPRRAPADLIALAQQVGADGVNWPFHPDFGADDPAAMAAQLRAAGLAVVSLGLTKQLSAVPGAQAEFREAFAQCAQAAPVFGTRVIDCWPCRAPDVTKDLAQATLAENLAAVAPLAQRHQCSVSLEFEPDATIERYGEASRFLTENAPHARLTADTYHIIRIGDDLAAAGAALGTQMGIVHFSGSHRGEPGSEDDRCDYLAFLRAAVRAGYSGDIVLQYAPPADAAASLTRAVALTRRVIADLRA